ncbi:hypothetical protein MKK70_08825 [Methylobacterium sp. E-041]|jgi:uncharacterized Zn finger protein|uniref:hypothetical protein n=1 Tax=unclassified Methylobacterium TaxID=2615210 RepID=UPI00164F715B|nr:MULTISPECIES: hypothetical protein [unclassified Methylobacterium]MCJ2007364.1 hypothetical protein [Methylobacterium sp. J-092]MCJ2038002.1 hypothetical protein [Methylobacterium sp. J-059]MCJ2077162.1 hypothetical protein [Methylobacterium sp. E-016]MCJ2105481.1 hypothetical protein [Methylobacterium sp. E-041]MCJ2110023.1 hypothetical protein [Methylobacterium sp. E-025]
MIGFLNGRRTVEVPCTVEIEQTPESLHAHVSLDADFEIEPGDEVQVHDAPTSVPYGERLVVRRTATVTRAGRIERLWTKLAGHLELTELYEVSFSERRKL